MSAKNLAKAAAAAIGAKTFFDGVRCKNGHLAERRTRNSECVECCRKGRREAARRNRIPCPCKRLTDIERAHRRRLAQLKWDKANWTRVLANAAARRARSRGGGRFNKSDISNLLRIQMDSCAGCGARLNGKYEIDHIIPLVRGGSNWCGNLQLLCMNCNRTKADMIPVAWRMRRFGEVGRCTISYQQVAQ